MAYTPMQGSAAYQVIEFLTTNPDEELTADDIGAKFGRERKQVHSLLGAAVEAGALKRVTNSEDELVYRLGTGSPGVQAAPQRHPTLKSGVSFPAMPIRPVKPPRKKIIVDTAELKIEKGLPIPARGLQARADWRALFERMDVGDSVVVPQQTRFAVTKAATDFKRIGLGEIVLRQVSADEARVWRVK